MTLADTNDNTQSSTNEGGALGGDFKWLVAWLVLILIIAAANRTRVGQVVTYYALALMILFLVVTQFRFFVAALAPFQNLGPGLSSGSDAGPQGETAATS